MQVLSFEPISELPSWVVATIFGVPFIGGLIFYSYKTRHAKSWRKGIFPSTLKPTDDNFLEAYLALGAKLILINYAESKGKTTYLNNYFNRYFKFSNYNFGDSLLFSLKYPIQTKSVTDWLKVHYTDESSRSQIVYFLTGLTLVTGSINKRELAFLMEINSQLDLHTENLKQIIAIYASYSQSRESSHKAKKSNATNNLDYDILGVAQNATQDDIKKAFRKLVKIHHPDNFAQHSEYQQKLASEKFIEIQNAYERLTKS